jgi:hypothetical protein
MIVEWLAWLPSNWLWSLALTITPAAVAAIVSWLFRGRRPAVALGAMLETTSIVADLSNSPALTMQHGDVAVPNLNATTVLIWNSGAEEFRRNNVAEASPLRVNLGAGVTVLESTLLCQTNPARAAQFGVESTAITLDFDFLNPNDALALHVLTTGPVQELKLEAGLIGPTVALNSTWGQRFGVHGMDVGPHSRIINSRVFGMIGLVNNVLLAGLILAGFAWNLWPLALVAGSLLLLSAVFAVWPSNVVPRKVREAVASALKEDRSDP